MAKIDTVDLRTRLKPKAEPYRVKLSTGCTLGFRKMTPGSIGTWVARYGNADTGERDKRSLGGFGELPPSQRYSAAKAAAEHGSRTCPAEARQRRPVSSRPVQPMSAMCAPPVETRRLRI